MITVPSGAPIALVDDDEIDRMIITRVMKMSELDNPVIEFPSGQAFIDYLTEAAEGRANKLALVLMDINMPGMTGFEALAQIRSQVRLVDVPIVVMLTSSDAVSDIRKAKELGAQAYLAKQSGMDKFVAVINETFTNEVAA